MRYFIDTEFIESGAHNPIDLISIGIVKESGETLYCISNEFKFKDANDWVIANVFPHIGNIPRNTLNEIKTKIMNFIQDSKPEFWGYYADYDWVVFCQIFGSMINLPKGWPMFCRDIKQLCKELGDPKLPEQESKEHNSLSDAIWNKLAYEFLITKGA